MHSVTDSQTDRQSDIIMPTADHTACSVQNDRHARPRGSTLLLSSKICYHFRHVSCRSFWRLLRYYLCPLYRKMIRRL